MTSASHQHADRLRIGATIRQRPKSGVVARVWRAVASFASRRGWSRARGETVSELVERMEKLTSLIPGMVYQYKLRPDGSSCMPYASPGIRDVYRVAPESVREDATILLDHLHPDHYDEVLATIKASAETLSPWVLEYRIRFEDGSVRWLSGQAQPTREADGSILWHGYIHDVTERKNFEHELNTSRMTAEAANRTKSEFLANMSHEIRTPLTAILGYADLLREDGSIELAPQNRIETIDTIRSAGQHLLTVINDILDISKIEAGKMTIEMIETPLARILSEVASLLRPHALSKGVELDARLITPIPDKFASDPTRLRQILMNLVGNAVKFTERGSVAIEASVVSVNGADVVRIDIEDTGPGMSADQTDRLFSTFTQADATVTRKHGGTGLGLTICVRLADLMGGRVELVRTAPGVGSLFRLDLPLAPIAGARTITSLTIMGRAPTSSSAVRIPTMQGRILLAEDGRDNQRLFAALMRNVGASVEIAENGVVALHMIDEAAAAGSPFDLLVTDMQMPEMDGYTLTRTLRARGNLIAIVALTAHAMAEDRRKCLESGCDDYVTKPIDRRALLETCATWIGKQSPSGIVQGRAAKLATLMRVGAANGEAKSDAASTLGHERSNASTSR